MSRRRARLPKKDWVIYNVAGHPLTHDVPHNSEFCPKCIHETYCESCRSEIGRRQIAEESRAAYAARSALEIAARGARVGRRVADRETQHGRYLDCGPQAWDDR